MASGGGHDLARVMTKWQVAPLAAVCDSHVVQQPVMRDMELCWHVSEVELHARGASGGCPSRWSQRKGLGGCHGGEIRRHFETGAPCAHCLSGKIFGSLRHWSDERCLSTRFSACTTTVLTTPTDLGVFCVPSGEALLISHRCLCARAPGFEYVCLVPATGSHPASSNGVVDTASQNRVAVGQ